MVNNIILCDINKKISNAWKELFNNGVAEIVEGSIFEQDTDTIVTPGNSYAYMDGGLDRKICNFFGNFIETQVQRAIRNYRKNLFLPVGEAVLVGTNDKRIPYLIYAPTMQLPRNIRGTDNVYLAMKGILNCIKDNSKKLNKIAIPGLGTGVGEMLPQTAAMQMHKAFVESDLY